MKGLIKKDLLMIRGNIHAIILFLIVFSFICLDNSQILLFIPLFICCMIFISTFSYDDYNKWDAYAATLPIQKKDIVKAKYITNFIIILLGLVLSVAIVFTFYLIGRNDDIKSSFDVLLGSLIGIVFFQSILYPFIYKFGVEKGRIGIFVLVFGISIVMAMVGRYVNFSFPEEVTLFLDNWLWLVTIGLVLLMMGISYIVSKKIYLKKEY